MDYDIKTHLIIPLLYSMVIFAAYKFAGMEKAILFVLLVLLIMITNIAFEFGKVREMVWTKLFSDAAILMPEIAGRGGTLKHIGDHYEFFIHDKGLDRIDSVGETHVTINLDYYEDTEYAMPSDKYIPTSLLVFTEGEPPDEEDYSSSKLV